MRERVGLAGGELALGAAGARGTEVRVSLPLARATP
jgi:signal transduction histidine kinase